MPFVVPRKAESWELRESEATPAGPRARTLASFRTLDDDVLEHAAGRAQRPFDPDAARAAARRAGAPVARNGVDEPAARLLHRLRRERVSAPLRRYLIAALGGDAELSDAEEGAVEWIGASSVERGRILEDLLDLADALPHKRSGPLRYPPLRPADR